MKQKNNLTLLFLIAVSLLMIGCVPTEQEIKGSNFDENEITINNAEDKTSRSLPNIPLATRVAWINDQKNVPIQGSENLYSFVAENLSIQKALQVFGKAYHLNFITDNNVDGYLSLEFHDLPFEQAMSAMLDSLGFYWEREGQLIKVKSWETRTFTIDYLRLVRSGQGSSLANVNSTISTGFGDEGGGESGNDDGRFELSQEDSVEFWQELEEQLEGLVSDEGRLSINRMSGTVQISDLHARVEEVGKYINDINHAIHRQVELDVRIVEVELNNDFSLGINWGLVTNAGISGLEGEFNASSIITQPAGGFITADPTAALSLFEDDNGSLNFNALLTALKQQGDVHVVSQPKIRTLNNQSAMIKVGTDRTFFIRTVTRDTTTAGSTNLIEDTPSVVTEGIVLALTPQIAANGWIMMDISPIITRVTSVERVLDGDGNVTSSSPNLDIRQTSSLVRIKNGSTVAIGGLMQDTESNTNRSVPGVGDLPVVGKLFQGNYQIKRKKELVMFLTAKLVDTSDIAITQ
ncbi:MAG: secretin N-terminal domain-containing protein [Gammaproteobacteria bacterium]